MPNGMSSPTSTSSNLATEPRRPPVFTSSSTPAGMGCAFDCCARRAVTRLFAIGLPLLSRNVPEIDASRSMRKTTLPLPTRTDSRSAPLWPLCVARTVAVSPSRPAMVKNPRSSVVVASSSAKRWICIPSSFSLRMHPTFAPATPTPRSSTTCPAIALPRERRSVTSRFCSSSASATSSVAGR